MGHFARGRGCFEGMIGLEGLDMLREGALVLVAVSGGADSVALLSLLRDEARKRGFSLCAAHFEHGLRGQASLDDRDFVKSLCAGWDIPFVEGAADVRDLASCEGKGLEEAARNARHAFLEKTRRDTEAQCIALAHHMDDQAETVLMHLMRGSGLRGACGMRVWERRLWRPLLGVRKADLIAYLKDKGLTWREDATNAIGDNPRNILRLRAAPALNDAYPGYVEALARFSRLAQADEDYLEAQTKTFLRAHAVRLPIGWRLDCAEAHEALWRRAMRLLTGLDSDACVAAAALRLRNRGKIDLSGGVSAIKTGQSLYLLTKTVRVAPVPLETPGVTVLPGVCVITARPDEPRPSSDPYSQVVDWDALQGASVRTRRPGDRIQPLGMAGTRKLSDYLIDRHVDEPMRDITPIVARGRDVLWVAGVGISDLVRLREGSRGLRLTAEAYMRGWDDDGTA